MPENRGGAQGLPTVTARARQSYRGFTPAARQPAQNAFSEKPIFTVIRRTEAAMSTDPAGTGNVELLLNGRFRDLWTPIGPGGDWAMNSAGELVQKSLVGSTRGGTGAILSQKTAISAAVPRRDGVR